MTNRGYLSGTILIEVDMGNINTGKLPFKYHIHGIAKKYLNDRFKEILPQLEKTMADYLNRMELARGHPLIGTQGVSNIDLACWDVKLMLEEELSKRESHSKVGVVTISYTMANKMPPISYTITAKPKFEGFAPTVYTGEIYNLTARRLTKQSGYFTPSHVSKVQFDDVDFSMRKDRGIDKYGNPKDVEDGWREVTPAKLIIPDKKGGWRYADKAKFCPDTDYKTEIATAFQTAIIDTVNDLMNLDIRYAGVS